MGTKRRKSGKLYAYISRSNQPQEAGSTKPCRFGSFDHLNLLKQAQQFSRFTGKKYFSTKQRARPKRILDLAQTQFRIPDLGEVFQLLYPARSLSTESLAHVPRHRSTTAVPCASATSGERQQPATPQPPLSLSATLHRQVVRVSPHQAARKTSTSIELSTETAKKGELSPEIDGTGGCSSRASVCSHVLSGCRGRKGCIFLYLYFFYHFAFPEYHRRCHLRQGEGERHKDSLGQRHGKDKEGYACTTEGCRTASSCDY